MLELPESQVIASQLRDTIVGKHLIQVTAAASPHKFAFYSCDPAQYPSMLEGLTVTQAQGYGGIVELELEDMRFEFGDGATVRYLASGVQPPSKHQMLWQFDDGSHLVWTIQMYGSLAAFLKGTNDNPYYLVAKEKVSPLSDTFDYAVFSTLLSLTQPKLSVKAFLATEQRIPGLGNGTLQDILFNARLNPRTRLSALTDTELERLFHSVKDTLATMTAKGGRDTEKDLFGEPGGYRTILSSKTYGNPCPVCGHEIVRQAYLGGNVYFCPVCQPLV